MYIIWGFLLGNFNVGALGTAPLTTTKLYQSISEKINVNFFSQIK